MNICIVNNFFPPHISGTAHAMYMLSKELSKRGHEVVVITVKIGNTKEKEIIDGFTVYRLPCIKYPKLKIAHNADLYFAFTPMNLFKIIKIIREHDIEIIHTSGQFFDLTVGAIIAAKRYKIPVVLTIGTRVEHPSPIYNFILSSIDKTLIRIMINKGVDNVIAADKKMYYYMVNRYKLSAARISNIPYFVDTQKFQICNGEIVRQELGLSNDFVMLFLGHINNMRNPIHIIKSIPEILKEHPNTKFLFVGKLFVNEPLALVKKLNLTDSVIFCGAVDHAKIPDYIGAADIEAQDLTLGLGIGIAGLEAMAAGKPVIAAVPEDNFIQPILKNWENVVLVPPADTKAISNAIIRLLSDSGLREGIGNNAKKLIARHFSLDAQCTKHELLYQKLLTKSSKK